MVVPRNAEIQMQPKHLCCFYQYASTCHICKQKSPGPQLFFLGAIKWKEKWMALFCLHGWFLCFWKWWAPYRVNGPYSVGRHEAPLETIHKLQCLCASIRADGKTENWPDFIFSKNGETVSVSLSQEPWNHDLASSTSQIINSTTLCTWLAQSRADQPARSEAIAR